ncbi:probable serine/threonine-protein kinase DDB_G0282963 isoform X1 [Drosophila guanche]|uniref:Blast:Coiled-coil domain-containing protein 28B n=1 Tax=Drosophila guanche TaxID=7266 RepID=A0A3B0K2Q6_DROGU|nr:probable serine/threonine-protein kinase DDB_G0282963 isoform X1 [Drosophila guanche]SPP79291.1 blast:Coiled-coil domain-containing protein 28B [Drosophila guanche]
MEPNDEVVERQKLVPNDVETEEEAQSQSAPKSAQTPASPAVPNIKIKGISSGDTTRSRNSASCSIERTISEKDKDKGQQPTATKVTYVNERRPRPQAQGGSGGAGDERFEFKTRPRKLLKDGDALEPTHSSASSLNAITLVSSEWLSPDPTITNTTTAISTSTSTVTNNNNNNNDSTKPNHNDTSNNNNSNTNTPRSQRRKPAATAATSMPNASVHSDKFDDRPIKHHSFVSEVPDVKHMERALLGLLDDFHSGKLKAFAGSGCTMDQMTKIREQQESLAKLHFELAAAEEDSLEHGNEFNTNKAQENMLQLMQRLEQLSISIEQLQTSHTGL